MSKYLKAIKVLETRLNSLKKELNNIDCKYENAEMVSDVIFLDSDKKNIELEIKEIQQAINKLL